MKVHIVEDSKSVQELLATTAVECQCSVSGTTDNVRDAFADIMSSRPNIVILDLFLKDGSSLEVMKSVKERMPEVTFIVMTNGEESTYKEPCFKHGAGYFLQKNATHYQELRKLLSSSASDASVSEPKN